MSHDQDTTTEREHLLEWIIADTRAELDRIRGERPALAVKLDNGARMPSRSHPGDAGFDLYVSQDTDIAANSFEDVPSGVSVALPSNMWGLIIGRSSTLRNRGLMVVQGVIDCGYRGSLYAGCWNLKTTWERVEVGERIAQFIPLPLTAATLTLLRTETLPMGDRGTNGFGSTGS